MLNPKICQKARLSRDPRFDGKFFTAVKTTGIYCRPICPATTPKESNVTYFPSAISAANAGYRPCLRCRPDSAPGSPAWQGVNSTLNRAIRLINEGVLQEGTLQTLSQRLGVSDRYLRKLFKEHLGTSPKAYALYQQCLFAKHLLHQTQLPVTQVALASGFGSVRRFNDCFQSQLNLTPTQVRKISAPNTSSIKLQLHYRPPYDWSQLQHFFRIRLIPNLEWCDEKSYGRTFTWGKSRGYFTAEHVSEKYYFDVTLVLDDLTQLKPIVNNIRRVLDLDVDIQAVDNDLQQQFDNHISLLPGLRLPGIWNPFEAGIRAILGQQISVKAATTLVSRLVSNLGDKNQEKYFFPSPHAIANDNLGCLNIPESRKQTLRDLAKHFLTNENAHDPITWLSIKGIGPWTFFNQRKCP